MGSSPESLSRLTPSLLMTCIFVSVLLATPIELPISTMPSCPSGKVNAHSGIVWSPMHTKVKGMVRNPLSDWGGQIAFMGLLLKILLGNENTLDPPECCIRVLWLFSPNKSTQVYQRVGN